MKQLLSFMLFITSCSFAHAEPLACKDVPYDFSSHSSVELRTISQQCTQPEFRDLNLHRAYYKDLMADFNSFEPLDFDSPFMRLNPHRHARAFRMFIHLVEAFGANTAENAAQRAAILNQVYERANEIAELRLKGYKSRADWLELYGGMWSRDSKL